MNPDTDIAPRGIKAVVLAALIDAALSVSSRLVELSARLLGWRALCNAGRLLGITLFHVKRGRRRRVREELTRLFRGRGKTDADIDAMVRRTFESDTIRLTEMVFFGALTRERISKIVDVRGLEHLDAALARGRGVILLLAHFGSFMLPLPALGHRGYKVNQLAGVLRADSLLKQRIWRWRVREGDRQPVRFLHVGTFLRPVVEALGRNEIIVIAFDGRDAKNWAVADFLSRKAQFATGPFLMARKTGATIIPTFVVRQDPYSHACVLEPPFDLDPEPDEKKGAELDTLRFAALFASYVEKYPCHFGMILVKTQDASDAGVAAPLFVDK